MNLIGLFAAESAYSWPLYPILYLTTRIFNSNIPPSLSGPSSTEPNMDADYLGALSGWCFLLIAVLW
jgi:hypothetical protein